MLDELLVQIDALVEEDALTAEASPGDGVANFHDKMQALLKKLRVEAQVLRTEKAEGVLRRAVHHINGGIRGKCELHANCRERHEIFDFVATLGPKAPAKAEAPAEDRTATRAVDTVCDGCQRTLRVNLPPLAEVERQRDAAWDAISVMEGALRWALGRLRGNSPESPEATSCAQCAAMKAPCPVHSALDYVSNIHKGSAAVGSPRPASAGSTSAAEPASSPDVPHAKSCRCADCKADGAGAPTLDPLFVRLTRFRNTTGALTGGNNHPDRCVCNRKETGENADTPHVHYDEPPYACARCECRAYEPEVPEAADAMRTTDPTPSEERDALVSAIAAHLDDGAGVQHLYAGPHKPRTLTPAAAVEVVKRWAENAKTERENAKKDAAERDDALTKLAALEAAAVKMKAAAALQDERDEPSRPAPIPMRLTCPSCGQLHIDEGAFSTMSHHTHACQSCGHVWRPAVVKTVGVRFLPGFKDEGPTTTPGPYASGAWTEWTKGQCEKCGTRTRIGIGAAYRCAACQGKSQPAMHLPAQMDELHSRLRAFRKLVLDKDINLDRNGLVGVIDGILHLTPVQHADNINATERPKCTACHCNHPHRFGGPHCLCDHYADHAYSASEATS